MWEAPPLQMALQKRGGSRGSRGWPLTHPDGSWLRGVYFGQNDDRGHLLWAGPSAVPLCSWLSWGHRAQPARSCLARTRPRLRGPRQAAKRSFRLADPGGRGRPWSLGK